MTTPPNQSTISAVIGNLKQVASRQVELAKSELKPVAKRISTGSRLLAIAAIFALHALWMLLLSLVLAVGLLWYSLGMDPWVAFVLGFLTVSLLSIIIAAVLGISGKKQLTKIRKPEATITELKTTIAELQAALNAKKTQSTQPVGTQLADTPDRVPTTN